MNKDTELEALQKEKARLQGHVDWGRDILVFDELNFFRKKIKEVEAKIEKLEGNG